MNQIGNFDYVNVIADLIIKLIKGNASGIYNVGTESKSMFTLASKTKNVIPSRVNDILVPHNTQMNINKLNKFLNEN